MRRQVSGNAEEVHGKLAAGDERAGEKPPRLYCTVQSAKRLYPSCSRSNKKGIKFLAKPTQNPRKILAKSTLLPRYFHANSSLDSVSRLRFHACSTLSKKKSRSRKKNHAREKNSRSCEKS